MKFFSFLFLTLFVSVNLFSQQNKNVPFYEIPKASEIYTAGTAVGRMIDGLGFRYYWATEGLTPKDLSYKPNEKGRSSMETVEHIYDLTTTMLRLLKIEVDQSKEKKSMTFSEMRVQTLLNLQGISENIKKSKDLAEYNVIKDGKVAIPFWNIINGPIADAIWHSGQIASYRRSTGNPISSKINQFTGTVKK